MKRGEKGKGEWYIVRTYIGNWGGGY